MSWPPVEDDGEAVDTDGEDTCLQRGRCCCCCCWCCRLSETVVLETEASAEGEIGDEESWYSLACVFFSCLMRWSFRPKRWLQKEHWKSRLPVWTTSWRFKSLLVGNRLEHCPHWNRFSLSRLTCWDSRLPLQLPSEAEEAVGEEQDTNSWLLLMCLTKEIWLAKESAASDPVTGGDEPVDGGLLALPPPPTAAPAAEWFFKWRVSSDRLEKLLEHKLQSYWFRFTTLEDCWKKEEENVKGVVI